MSPFPSSRSVWRPLIALTAVLAAGAALTGCAGGPGTSASAAEADTSVGAAGTGASTSAGDQEHDAGESAGEAAGEPDAGESAAPCHDHAEAADLPAGFPHDLRLPDRTVVTGSERRSGDRIIVTAVGAAGFRPTLRMLQQRLPAAGYRLTEGEVEEHDAESDFSSAHVRGRWTLREIPGCEGDVLLTVLVAPR